MANRMKIPNLRRWLRKDEGTASVEFVMWFPVMMFLMFSSIEISVLLARAAMLDRAVDINVRSLRLGTMSPMNSEELRRRICEDAMILSDCSDSMMIELVPISTTSWTLPAAQITCVERDENIQPVVDFIPGGLNEIMIVRACAVIDPFFTATPYVMDLPKDASGGYRIAAASIFVNEP